MNEKWANGQGWTILMASGIMGIAVIIGGYLLGDGLLRARQADRSVTVRGLAEKDVTADLATWTLSFSKQGFDLNEVQTAADRDANEIRAFFKSMGFPDDALSTAGVNVNQWYDSNRGVNNVTVRQKIQLRTNDIARARKAFTAQFDLVRRGIALEEGSGMVYSFTKLNDIKPAMVADATKDARNAAEQFAKDSGTDVGGIKSATQGYFSIGARDGDDMGSGAESPYKKVRVVTTVDFYLE
ncbi:SIMPL domain-containing protein [Rhizorhapis sp. SPR117]|uniref:SIMPL domain-containing protein n=1 Tax=Rhizorhapis sp. SPR117 TaxID=2912611 RepID=UPI001F201AF9|nr:SIMPL domain-containing protein [Rhizorhapis sp. SPR117]